MTPMLLGPTGGAFLAMFGIDPTNPHQTRALLAQAIESTDNLAELSELDGAKWSAALPRLAPRVRGIVEEQDGDLVVVFLWPDDVGLAGARALLAYVKTLPRDRRVIITPHECVAPLGFRSLGRLGFVKDETHPIYIRALGGYRECYIREASGGPGPTLA
jgi:hypothetical protein